MSHNSYLTDPSFWAAIGGVTSACVAAFFSWQGKKISEKAQILAQKTLAESRMTNRATARPALSLETDQSDTELIVKIANIGLGPALDVVVVWEFYGKPVRTGDLLYTLERLLSDNGIRTSSVFMGGSDSGYGLAVGAVKAHIIVRFSSSEDSKKMELIEDSVRPKITYKSVYDDPFAIDLTQDRP